MAPVRRRVQHLLTAAPLALALLAGCGDDRPDSSDIRDAQKSATQPLYWAGEEVAGQALSAITRNGGVVTFLYGDCKNEEREGGCAVPISVQTAPICTVKALFLDVRPTRSRRVCGITARVRGASTLDLPTGTSNVTVRADSPARLGRTVAALRAVEGGSRGELPPPRYPLEYIEELRRTRDAFVRTGSVRAARDELRISQRAIRFRLRLAEKLGSARLRRPAAEFVGQRPCPVDPAS
ncbi:MAG TPA: hypothetical protein VGV90_08920 [Solirubrobacteraceae bacterium]|nr:hypothetical protein [Solirubrobacteraceae bacterium]